MRKASEVSNNFSSFHPDVDTCVTELNDKSSTTRTNLLFHLPRRSPSSTPSEKASRKRFFSPFRQCRWASSPHDSLENPKHLRPPNQTFTISRATKPQQADLDSGLLFLIVDLFMALANGRELSRWVVRNVDIYSCSSPSPNKVAHKNSHIWTFTASSSSETFPVVNITLNEQFPTTFNDYCLITIWPDKTLRSTTGRSSMSSTQWEKYWAGFPSSGVENPRAERKLWRFGWQQNVLWNVSREQWSIEFSCAKMNHSLPRSCCAMPRLWNIGQHSRCWRRTAFYVLAPLVGGSNDVIRTSKKLFSSLSRFFAKNFVKKHFNSHQHSASTSWAKTKKIFCFFSRKSLKEKRQTSTRVSK